MHHPVFLHAALLVKRKLVLHVARCRFRGDDLHGEIGGSAAAAVVELARVAYHHDVGLDDGIGPVVGFIGGWKAHVEGCQVYTTRMVLEKFVQYYM